MKDRDFRFPRSPWLWVAAIAFFLIPTISYWPGLNAGFYFDDLDNIVRAEALHWEEFSFQYVKNVLTEAWLPRRPVANLSFAFNYLFGGLDPKGYHQINLLIHLLTGISLLWVVYMLVLHRKREGKDYLSRFFFSSFMVSLLFLVHPLNIQAVTYVVQRMTSLATFFFLLAFGCYLYARNWAKKPKKNYFFGLSTIFWLLALGSKENAVLLPLIIVIYEFSFHRQSLRKRIMQITSKHSLKMMMIAVVVLIMIIGAIIYNSVKPELSWNENLPNRDFSGYQRVLTQTRVQVFYLSLFFWPVPSRLNLDHDFMFSESFFKPWTTLPAFLFWLGIFCLSLYLVFKNPIYGFSILMYLALHLIESGPLSLELVFEHRMYLPMTALALLLANVFLDLKPVHRKIAWLVLGICISFLAFATYTRNQTWSDLITFHYDCTRKSPNKFRPQYNLGTELGKLKRYHEAIEALTRAIEIRPEFSESHNQLGNCYLALGNLNKAVSEYSTAVQLKPNNAEAVYNLAAIYDRKKDYDKAKQYYRHFLAIAPDYLENYKQNVKSRLMRLSNIEEE